MDGSTQELTQDTIGQPPGPCAMVIFGAGGDLTKRKLIPALYNLARGKLLPEQFAIIGVSIEPYSTEDFRKRTTDDIKQFATGTVDMNSWDWFNQRLYYLPGDFDDAELYKKIEDMLGKVDVDQSTGGNCLFYLATSPTFFPVVVDQLGKAGLTRQDDGKWRRVVIEKPFGHDLQSAVALNKSIGEVL